MFRKDCGKGEGDIFEGGGIEFSEERCKLRNETTVIVCCILALTSKRKGREKDGGRTGLNRLQQIHGP